MARDLLDRKEELVSESVPKPVYGLPEWVVAGWPTEEDLGVEDDQPVQSKRHRNQADLLLHLIERVWGDHPGVLIAGDLGVYYHPTEPPVAPDVMVAFGIKPKEDWPSFAVWEEGKGPEVVIELLSRSNQNKDRTTNYEIYQQWLQVPEYFWFDPLNPSELRRLRLRGGQYEAIVPDEQGRLWSEALGVWFGVHERWLRLYDREGNLVPTGDELAQQERAAREAAEAEVARLREELARLKAKG